MQTLSEEGETFESWESEIVLLDFNEERLLLTLADPSTIKVWDDGQCCCEHRYLTCDDSLDYYIGSRLRRLELRKIEEKEEEYGDVHEIGFLIVHTSKGEFTICTHNEHNGYYGSFSLRVERAIL